MKKMVNFLEIFEEIEFLENLLAFSVILVLFGGIFGGLFQWPLTNEYKNFVWPAILCTVGSALWFRVCKIIWEKKGENSSSILLFLVVLLSIFTIIKLMVAILIQETSISFGWAIVSGFFAAWFYYAAIIAFSEEIKF